MLTLFSAAALLAAGDHSSAAARLTGVEAAASRAAIATPRVQRALHYLGTLSAGGPVGVF